MKPGISSNFEINRPLWKKIIKSFFNLFGLEVLRTNNFIKRRENLVVELDNDNYSKELRSNALIFCALIYMQLILGALMRHTASGLAIPDFPTMGGQWLPTFSDKMMNNINVILFENDLDLVIRAQSLIHFLHRLGAVAVSSFLIYFFVYYNLKAMPNLH